MALAACAAWLMVAGVTATPAASSQATPRVPRTGDDFPYDDFVGTTLANIARLHADDVAGATDASLPIDKPVFNLDSRALRYRVRVTWLGQSRPITGDRKHMFALRFSQMQIADPDRYYVNEYLVDEGGRKYWLPMQVPLEAHFAEELRVGGKVDLYLVDLGSIILHGKNDIVLMVEEFGGEP